MGTAVLAVVLQRGTPAGHTRTPRRRSPAPTTPTYWWALGIAALWLVPCIVLLRAEGPGTISRAETVAESTVEPLGT